MLEDVLNSVKQAESEAADMVAAAEERAAGQLRQGQQQVAADWQTARSRAKAQRASRLDEAESHATAAAQHIATDYADQCAALHTQGMAEVDGLVDFLMEKVFNGSC